MQIDMNQFQEAFFEESAGQVQTREQRAQPEGDVERL